MIGIEYIFIIQFFKMSKEWKTHELQLLDSLAGTYRGKNWKTVARQMSKEGYLRTEVQCRYKWVNYIAPGINHNPWSQEQLAQLFKGYELHKSQWALIQRSLPGRTQIKIRNQFYGTLRNLLRFSIKYFKTGNGYWSLISNQVKPQILQNLFEGIGEFQFVGDIIREAIREMDFKFRKEKFDLIISKNLEIFKKIVHIINNSDCLIKRRVRKHEESSQKNGMDDSENEEDENEEPRMASGNLINQQNPEPPHEVEAQKNYLNPTNNGQSFPIPNANDYALNQPRCYTDQFHYYPMIDPLFLGNPSYNIPMNIPQMQYYSYQNMMSRRPGYYYPF